MYEKLGFAVMHIAEMNFENASLGEDWVRSVKDLQANSVAIMWRPCWGKVREGRDYSSLGSSAKKRIIGGAISLELASGSRESLLKP